MTQALKTQPRRFSFGLRTLFVAVLSAAVPLGFLARNLQKNVDAVLPSASFLLSSGDYEKFRPGRSKADILNDVQWRGNFEQAAPYNGKSVSLISYGLFGGPLSDHGTGVLAVFVDDKFEKFVRCPEGNAKIKVGDFSFLGRAIESDPVSILDLEKEMKNLEVPRQTDWGLTAVFLVLGPCIEAARAPGLRKNVALRDQFNGARLKIGMAESEVEAALKAKPIESGEVEAGSFKIYGSNESFNITYDLHYSGILVLFKEGRAIGIYSGWMVHGGDRFQELRQVFVDLPERREK